MLEMGEEVAAFNGINASTGEPILAPVSLREVIRLACGEKWDERHLAELKERKEREEEDDMEVIFGVDRSRLEESGWAVIFPHGVADEIREALSPLLEHRRAEAESVKPGLYRELTYRPGESKQRFLARHKVAPGPVDPEQIPYYLLIVGGPEEIPFTFQYQLDVQYAVGRIVFDTVEEYATYARSVVTVERAARRRARKMALFGVSNEDDRATLLSLRDLVMPLAAELRTAWEVGSPALAAGRVGWSFEEVLGDAATKANLARVLGGDGTPSLLFTASHGVGFEADDPRQRHRQGALLCQDWPGPRRWRRPLPDEHYFSAGDVPDDADLTGLISFHFACYGAGTPAFDEYAHRESSRRRLAPESFLSRLPQRLLSHPGGGALAAVGHVDRAWSYSFNWPEAPQQLNVFTSCIGRLFDGYPLGAAMEHFNLRYAELSSDVSAAVQEINYGETPDFLSLPGLWTANNDARSYVVVGDPAVRLVSR